MHWDLLRNCRETFLTVVIGIGFVAFTTQILQVNLVKFLLVTIMMVKETLAVFKDTFLL